MPRKTVKVDVPREPTDLVNLLLGITKQNKKLGPDSPIGEKLVNMAEFEERAKRVDILHNEIVKQQRELQQKLAERDGLLGIAKGQNARTEGTLLFETLKIRDSLLAFYRAKEENIKAWGYRVSLGSAAGRRPKTQEVTPVT